MIEAAVFEISPDPRIPAQAAISNPAAELATNEKAGEGYAGCG